MLTIVIVAIITAVIFAIGGFIGGVYAERYRGVPLWQTEDRWAIGIYFGETPFKLAPSEDVKNPVLTASDVTDLKASFVADPFMVREGSTWYMFLEAMDARTYRGKIGLAMSNDGVTWKYQKTVLDEPFHLSYPYIFKWQNEYYLLPECYQTNAVRLYRAVTFPCQWKFVGELLQGSYVDASIFRYHDRWWLFAANQPGNDQLSLFYAQELLGPWIEHPQSPVIKADARIARPGGKVLVLDGRVFRYTQDCAAAYGTQLRAFEITELTPDEYAEREVVPSPILRPGKTGWNANGMHHIDPHRLDQERWIACVDGNRQRVTFRLKY
jgi:hypothetical protein